MRGVGRANGAITIVNALATGVGCACGIELTAEAEVEMSRTGAPRPDDTSWTRTVIPRSPGPRSGPSSIATRRRRGTMFISRCGRRSRPPAD